MGKLNIAHHKSYHPYRRDNIERVRRDEEEAAAKEAQEEGRVMLADSEARLEALRDRAGLGKGKGKAKETDDMKELAQQMVKAPQGHINLFEDLEQQATMTAIRASKKTGPPEAEKGFPLAPSAKDLRPWYSTKRGEPEPQPEADGDKYKEEERRKRDAASKSRNDPLTAITHQLASRYPPPLPPARSRTQSSFNKYNNRSTQPIDPPPPPNSTTARLNRESSERERALALIARKKRELAGSATPSTVRGDDDGGYRDVFNRREVEEAHRRRPKAVRWGDDDGRRRGGW
ncbi:hypothetical protein BJ138DRAFT_1093383 [Hygrophoropsis aurantiaca]|uniref:Uncharacterized protein n=1 Tax=Hygrophoropsis aurantiaca TaxID=72124 RepID=A0ACB8A1W7_9AGAM|nr:hypothetical protein BJ138DRAFT_1093383 [Hygrophoropsis aurantiaca]